MARERKVTRGFFALAAKRREARLWQARSAKSRVPDIFCDLQPLNQPPPLLYARRTPLLFGVAVSDDTDVIDMSDLLREDMERSQHAEEELKRQEDEKRKHAEEESNQQKEEERKRKEEEERKQREDEDLNEAEVRRKVVEDEEERRATEAEEQAQTREQEAQPALPPKSPFKSRPKQRAHKNPPQGSEERRKKFKNDIPAWERRAPPPPPPQVKKKYKFKPGTVALREIQKYQKSSELLIPKAPFAWVVKEVMEECSDSVTRIQSNAVLALQEASEDMIVSVMQDSVLCHVHAQRVTLKPKDLALALRLRDKDYHRKV